MTPCATKHTQEEELKVIEYSAFLREIVRRYYQHDGLACQACVDNVYKLRSIIDGDE